MANTSRSYSRLDSNGAVDITLALDKLRRAIDEALGAMLEIAGAYDLSSSIPPAPIASGTLHLSEHALDVLLPNGRSISLARRGPARRLFKALVAQHSAKRGQALSIHEAFEAGWPNELAHPEAAAARVYTTIRILRNLGLRPWLLGRDDGYLLAPDLVVFCDAGAAEAAEAGAAQ